MKQKVQILADETAHSLKKNVYKNYSQFIETAKEISSMIKMKTWYMYGEIAKESIQVLWNHQNLLSWAFGVFFLCRFLGHAFSNY